MIHAFATCAYSFLKLVIHAEFVSILQESREELAIKIEDLKQQVLGSDDN